MTQEIKTETDKAKTLKKVGKGSLFGLLGNLTRLFANLLFYGIVARYLTKDEFGYISLAIALINILKIIATLGFPKALPGFVAEKWVQKDVSSIRGALIFSWTSGMGLAIGMALFLVFGADGICGFFNRPGFAHPIKVFAVLVPVTTAMGLMASFLQSFHDIRGMVWTASMPPLIRVVLAGLCISLGLSFNYILLSYVLSFVCVTVAIAWLFARKIPWSAIGRVSKPVSKELLVYSTPLLVIGLLEILNLWAGAFILGGHAPPEDVGAFNAGMRLTRLLRMLYLSTGFIFLPVAAQLYQEKRAGELQGLYATCTKWLIIATLPFFFVFTLIPDQSMALFFGRQYSQGNSFFIFLSLGFFLHVLVGLSELSLLAMGKTKTLMTCAIITAGVNFILISVLIPAYGLLGAAICSCAALVMGDILTSVCVYRAYRLHPFTRDYLKMLALPLAVLVTLFIGGRYGMIHLNPLSVVTAALVIMPVSILVTKSFSADDMVLFRLVEIKITRKTAVTDRLSNYFNLGDGK